MSLLIDINPSRVSPRKYPRPLRDRLISGNPAYRSWPQDASRGDKVKTGVWEATGEPHQGHDVRVLPYPLRRLEIKEKGGETRTFWAGDSSAMKPQSVGVWPTIKTVREIYVCVETERQPIGKGGIIAFAGPLPTGIQHRRAIHSR